MFASLVVGMIKVRLWKRLRYDVVDECEVLNDLEDDLNMTHNFYSMKPRGRFKKMFPKALERAHFTFALLWSRLSGMEEDNNKENNSNFKWQGGYKKDDKPSQDDRLGKLNVDGFNMQQKDNRKLKEEISEVKEQNKENTKKLEDRIEKLEKQNDAMMALLKDMSKRLK